MCQFLASSAALGPLMICVYFFGVVRLFRSLIRRQYLIWSSYQRQSTIRRSIGFFGSVIVYWLFFGSVFCFFLSVIKLWALGSSPQSIAASSARVLLVMY